MLDKSSTYQPPPNPIPINQIPRRLHQGRSIHNLHGRIARQGLVRVEHLGSADVGAEEVFELPDYRLLPGFVNGGAEAHFCLLVFFFGKGFRRVV